MYQQVLMEIFLNYKILIMNELLSCSPYIIAGLKDMGDLPKRGKITQPYKHKFKKIVPAEIFENVSKYFDIPIEKIKSKTRRLEIVYARKLCVYLIRKYTKLSLKDVTEIFPETLTHHTSVIHSQKYIANQISGKFINQEIYHDLETIIAMLKGMETIKFNNVSN